jgi:hypothetical protein
MASRKTEMKKILEELRPVLTFCLKNYKVLYDKVLNEFLVSYDKRPEYQLKLHMETINLISLIYSDEIVIKKILEYFDTHVYIYHKSNIMIEGTEHNLYLYLADVSTRYEAALLNYT